MKYTPWLMLVLLGCDGAIHAPDSSPDLLRISLLGDRTFPEGIAVHSKTGVLFVGGLVSGDLQKVVAGRASYFAPDQTRDLQNVVGLAVDAQRNRLWVCSSSFLDPTRLPSLWVFDTETEEPVAQFEIPVDGQPHFSTMWPSTRRAMHTSQIV